MPWLNNYSVEILLLRNTSLANEICNYNRVSIIVMDDLLGHGLDIRNSAGSKDRTGRCELWSQLTQSRMLYALNALSR